MLLFGFGSFGLPLALCLNLNNLALISALSLLIWYIWEEFLLYGLLGVFMIYLVDSFARAGKYIR
jgi:uncharacterized membrane protein YqjE